MQKAFLFALPAVILGLAACNKTSREKADETAAKVQQEAKEAVKDIKETAGEAAATVKEDSREVVADVKESAAKAADKIRDEAGKAGSEVKAEARQAGRDISDALGLDQARTKADEKLNRSIRAALKANKVAARDIDDIALETDNGNVQIKGTVTTEEVKKEIASTVRKVAGLTKVTDKVNVADRVGAGSND
jgi:osmotically-inducible protein OsmY